MVTKETKYCPTCNSGVLKPYSYHDNNLGNTLVKGMKCYRCNYFIPNDEIDKHKKAGPVVIDKNGEDSVSCNVDAAPGSVCSECAGSLQCFRVCGFETGVVYNYYRCLKCSSLFLVSEKPGIEKKEVIKLQQVDKDFVCPECDALNSLYEDSVLHPKKMFGFSCSICHSFFSNADIVKIYRSQKVEKSKVSVFKEEELVKKAADLWNEYIKLDNIDDCESLEIASAIHTIQGRLAIRMHRRDVKDSPFCKQGIDGKD